MPANFLLSRPNAAEYCNSEKNLLSTDGCSTRVLGLVNFGLQTPEIHESYTIVFGRNLRFSVSGMAERRFPKLLHMIDGRG